MATEDAARRAAEVINEQPPLFSLAGQLHTLVVASAADKPFEPLAVPVRGVITSGFGPRLFPVWGDEVIHEGIDIGALPGTSVRAARGGTVVATTNDPNNGLTVIIDHGGDGEGRRLQTVYAHLASIRVSEGQQVRGRHVIGTVGSTGEHSTGPHLHFEVHLEGQPVDPRAWL